jgi:hypothetical protein
LLQEKLTQDKQKIGGNQKMKILTKIVIVAFLTTCAATALAAGLGDVVQPIEQGKISITPEYTHVFDRDFNQSGEKVDKYDQAYANIAYGIADNVKLYTKLGVADMNIKGRTSASETTQEEYSFGFLWGGGISGNLKLQGDWIIGFDSQYTAWNTDFDAITVNGEKGTKLAGKLKNDEWQAALYAGKEIAMGTNITLTPYTGVKVARLESDIKGLSFETSTAAYVGTGTLKNDNEFGVVVGTNLKMSENLKVNIEGQFVDETGLTAGLTYKF